MSIALFWIFQERNPPPHDSTIEIMERIASRWSLLNVGAEIYNLQFASNNVTFVFKFGLEYLTFSLHFCDSKASTT